MKIACFEVYGCEVSVKAVSMKQLSARQGCGSLMRWASENPAVG
jgi:hypothetical protein